MLPFSDGKEPRVALEIMTILPSNDTVVFVGTHLDHTSNEYDRITQATKINQAYSDAQYPTILAGDLNDFPGSSTIDILEEFWTSSYNKENPAFTYPSDNPTKKIDYIMFYPGNRWRILEVKVVCDSVASDHCAYLVVLELLY